MKAKILKPFSMGGKPYNAGDVCEFEPWRVERLAGEGLAVAVVEDAPVAAVEIDPEPQEPTKKRGRPRKFKSDTEDF